MEKLDIILTVMVTGFGLSLSLMLIMWNALNKRIDAVENGLNVRIDRLSDRVDKLSDKVEDIDRRLCRIEGSLASQGHCLFSQNQSKEKIQ